MPRPRSTPKPRKVRVGGAGGNMPGGAWSKSPKRALRPTGGKGPRRLLDATKGRAHQRGLPGTKSKYNRTERTSMT